MALLLISLKKSHMIGDNYLHLYIPWIFALSNQCETFVALLQFMPMEKRETVLR